MDRWFWIGQVGVVALLFLGLAWPPCFVGAAVLQCGLVVRAVVRAMRAMAALDRESAPAPPPDAV